MTHRFISFLLALVLFSIAVARADQYFQDFSGYLHGTTSFDDGSELFATQSSGAGIQDDQQKELRLTSATEAGARATFVLPPMNATARLFAFSAKWNSAISGNFQEGGGRFSFALAPPGSYANYEDETGLSFSVQTDAASPGFYLRVYGRVIASKPFVAATQWGVLGSRRHFFEVDWHFTEGVSVKLNGAPIFTKVLTPVFSPQLKDRFIWAARSGNGGQEISLDNIVVAAGGNLARVVTSGFFSSQRNSNFGPRLAFDDNENTEFGVFDTHAGFVGGNASPARSLLFYSLTSGVDSPDPHHWTIEGATTSAGPWSPLAAGDWNFTHRKETRAWPITHNAAFPSFRISFPTNNSNIAEVYVGELRLLEFHPAKPFHVVDVSGPTGGRAEVRFAGSPGITYFGQVATDVSAGDWRDFGSGTADVNGLWSAIDASATNEMRFYRAR